MTVAGDWRALGDCRAVLVDGTLILENSRVRRQYAWNDRHLVGRQIVDLARDHMILLNTWGDRGQDTRISEAFALAELEQAARLGITHFQLDDGWQAGRTSNSAYAGGSLENIWESGRFWEPHPERFPNGLGPVVERGREMGIELCLWFNPSRDDSYAQEPSGGAWTGFQSICDASRAG